MSYFMENLCHMPFVYKSKKLFIVFYSPPTRPFSLLTTKHFILRICSLYRMAFRMHYFAIFFLNSRTSRQASSKNWPFPFYLLYLLPEYYLFYFIWKKKYLKKRALSNGLACVKKSSFQPHISLMVGRKIPETSIRYNFFGVIRGRPHNKLA